MKRRKKTYEPKLNSIDIDRLSDGQLFRFVFGRKSFYRDYNLLHTKEEERVRERIGVVLFYVDLLNLAREIRLCFLAALESPRKTYMFNLYVIELIEMHYSNESFSANKKEIVESRHLCHYDSQAISYEWVLYSNQLSPYQRYLLFEYLALGYTYEDLAKRRYCTTRTIHNHFKAIVLQLGH